MFKLKMIFIALFGLIHTQGFAAAPAAAGAGAAVSSDSDSDFEVFIPRDINKEYRQQITWLNAMLAKASDEEMRNQAFDRVTHRLIDCTFPAEVLERWLAWHGNPNNMSQGYKDSPLFRALVDYNEKAIKVLLADLRTNLDPYFLERIKCELKNDETHLHNNLKFFKRLNRLILFLQHKPVEISIHDSSEEQEELSKEYVEFSKIKLARGGKKLSLPNSVQTKADYEQRAATDLSLQNGIGQNQTSETSLQAPLSTQVAVGGKRKLSQTLHHDEPPAKKQKTEIQHPQQVVLGK